MARATWVQSNFNGGEWSPLAHGRFDLAKYRNGLETCLSFLPTQQGGLTRRPGTPYVAAVKDSTYAPRLIKFEFNINQAYILELGDQYIRFYTNDGQILTPASSGAWAAGVTYAAGTVVNSGVGIWVCLRTHLSAGANISFDGGTSTWAPLVGTAGAPLEIATPYSIAEVWALDFDQQADTIYIVHPSHYPKKLQRHSAYGWTILDAVILDGPYLAENATTTTLTPSGTSGTVTVTANSTTGINGDRGFLFTDIGRQLRIKCGGVWLNGTIGTIVSHTQVTWYIVASNGATGPRTATAIANVSGGSVFSVTVTDGGAGYGATPPSVTILAHNNDPATATLTVVAGVITNINLTHGGSGYAGSPFGDYLPITVTGSGGTGLQAVATLSLGVVTGIVLTNGGTGYSATDTVTFVGGTAAGSGAVAYATVSDGVVTSITVSVTGTGYGTAADVFLSAPTALAPSTTVVWRLGEWNGEDGYPKAVTFHQSRLCFSGNAANPDRVNGSNVGDYDNFAPTSLTGVVSDSHAFSFLLGVANGVQWLESDKQGLICGTGSGEIALSPSGAQQALTPTNVNAKPLGNYGSAAVKPVRIGNSTMFVQRTKRKLREVIYQFAYDNFTNVDISLVAEHLTRSGIKQMAVQFAPYQMVWMVRNDGALVAMTYDRDQEVNGWHRHVLGGYSDAAKTLPPLVESVACIPSPDVLRDEPWFVVKRYINGATVRTVERMAKVWEDGDALADAVFLDCSATYSGAPTITVSGLTWLKGQTVSVLVDGAVHPDCVVNNSGVITLNWSGSKVQVGLGYVSQAKTLRIEAGGADGPSQGKLKRIFRAVVRFFQTNVFDLWSDAEGVGYEPQAFRDTADLLGQPVPLYTGDKRWSYDGEWASDGQVAFQASKPLPCNITLLMAQLDTQDAQ